MSSSERTYLPAAGHDIFLPLYDLVSKLLGSDKARRALLDQTTLRPGERALEIGCGTGTFIVALKKRFPEVEVTGLDPDPKALARARKKIARAGITAQLHQGFADALEYPPANFDAVFSSFMYHHLQADKRGQTLAEARRVLKPGGNFYLLDFETAEPGSGQRTFCLFHSPELLRDNTAARISELMHEVGFSEVKKVAELRRPLGLGRVSCWRANL